ncbi:aminobenzoyl-glutamate transport protein [Caminicella sporogenes DSM 14501]|uniref:Aminobenzoyl-glutamate transport protein n=1 Tax=Caminicella sporogenes DSM 14501 TaxID=1121266 RepID=A0A1M6SXD5_9FIRM|nr:AbgT family transporter [Caminicella sporogenes]RKD21930.1 aminobenzoyl-glutamate transporter [Caminicella sporogenes]SHK49310.1 aminobenzoyl-glutamate transport protein [Caminicella sporogenes DSM 14501]
MKEANVQKKKLKGVDKFLNWVEKVGNRLPEPLTLFVWLAGLALLVSLIGSIVGISAVHPLTKEKITVVNLLSKEGIQKMLMNAVSNFAKFPPLGLVLTCILGVGLAEKTGLFSALLRKTLVNVKGSKVIVIVIFTSIMANAAGDTGFIVMPPLAAMLFAAVGMNPIVGMMAAYAAVAGGFSANLFVNSLDVLVVGFTQSAVELLDPNFQVNPACNWYFLMVSTFFLTFAATWVTVKIVAPRMGKGSYEVEKIEEVTEEEIKGLKAAGIATLAFLILLIISAVPQNGLLREPKTGSLLSFSSPLMKGLVPIITLLFFIPGYVFGKVSGKIKSDKDTVAMLGESMSEMGPYIVLSFVIAQFINYFNWSNLGIIMAIKGADFLKNLGAPTPVLLICFILIGAFINLFVGSCSAKWAILSPIFVPMFILLGFHPALTQMTYRIGDSITNVITPLLPYFAILVAFAKKYDKNIGMGTLIANMLPYSISFFIIWTIQLLIWYFLKLPLGPGSPIIM